MRVTFLPNTKYLLLRWAIVIIAAVLVWLTTVGIQDMIIGDVGVGLVCLVVYVPAIVGLCQHRQFVERAEGRQPRQRRPVVIAVLENAKYLLMAEYMCEHI